MRLKLYSWRNSQASPFLHKPRSQCLQTVAKRSRSRGCVGNCFGGWKFRSDGVVCRSGQWRGPRGQPAGVSDSLHIWSSIIRGVQSVTHAQSIIRKSTPLSSLMPSSFFMKSSSGKLFWWNWGCMISLSADGPVSGFAIVWDWFVAMKSTSQKCDQGRAGRFRMLSQRRL